MSKSRQTEIVRLLDLTGLSRGAKNREGYSTSRTRTVEFPFPQTGIACRDFRGPAESLPYSLPDVNPSNSINRARSWDFQKSF